VRIDPRDWIGWLWPVLVTKGRRPVISHEFEGGNRYNPDGSLNYAVHLGVDLMFPRLEGDPTGPATDVAIPKNGSLGWITWPGTEVVAIGPGKVWGANRTRLGLSVLIDHGHVAGGGMLSFYQHLETFARPWKKDDVITPGTVLGTMGGDPMNAPHLRHLHFELWRPDDRPHAEWPVDPLPYLTIWPKV
jgi:murein DD-endopeptidase MepM/ murein hydrolase activator NlpD